MEIFFVFPLIRAKYMISLCSHAAEFIFLIISEF